MKIQWLTPGQSITASDTIVSAGNVFKLGFFSHWNGSSNRNYPLTDSSAAFSISDDGNLAILKGKIFYMLTNISSNGNTSATLLDSRNLVLRDKTSGREDHGPGVFSLEFDPQGMPQFFILKGSQKYWTSGVWTGQSYRMIPDMRARNIHITYVFGPWWSNFTYFVTDASVTNIFVLDVSEKLQLLSWSKTTHQWDLFWSQPSQQCRVYAYCGAFSICIQKALPFCQCLSSFEPHSVRNWNAGDLSRGCVRKAPLQCVIDSHANGHSDQ
ncbi:G-type lectin S-receptor-like serine/threonine-protein kinase At2g19130 [Camellia sinensis]|uniref:G-type lectin S-receptor-like serine/threonine-protein kinase At2g19130 n=1 Tax=Camellia sinensis TaxID=4442 RepID=UPI001036D575|nr:G-type lectin S-receptor-like serine/threonine-protein kinase At2g19130 [Camellia sinensis]